MGKDMGDVIGTALGKVTREAVQSIASNGKKAPSGPLSGGKGLAAGAGLVALAPLAAKGASKLASRGLRGGVKPVKKAGDKLSGGVKDVVGDKLSGGVKDAVGDKVEQAGGAAGMAKEAGKGLLPGGGGKSDDKSDGKSTGQPGVGKGRRMPIQQAIDVAVPVSTAYNQWTQFEDWPQFMHRLENVTQDDECHVSFKTKIWGISKEFSAEIIEQRPDERIKWSVTDGVGHTGVITFHELAPRLTRIEANIDVHPGSLIEKAGRGMRHAKRAVRADLARYKAYMEMEEEETGAWRGEIEDGEVKSSSSGDKKSSSRSSASSRGSSSKASGGSSSSRKSSASGGSSSSRKSSGSKGSGSSSSSRKSSGSKATGRSSSSRKSSASGGSSSSRKTYASGGSSSSRKSSASGGSSSSPKSSASKASGGSSSGRKSSSSSGGRSSSASSRSGSGSSSRSSSNGSGSGNGSSRGSANRSRAASNGSGSSDRKKAGSSSS